MKKYLINLATDFAIKLVNNQIKDSEVYNAGVEHGEFLSREFKDIIGDTSAEKIETTFQKYIGLYYNGIMDGLDLDD